MVAQAKHDWRELLERFRAGDVDASKRLAGICLGYLLARFQGLAPSMWFAANSDIFAGLAELGMFFLMLLAGIRMEPLDFARSSKSAVLIAVGGMLVPVSVGFGLGFVVLPESSFKIAQSLFLGVALAITAVPVAVRLDTGSLAARFSRPKIASSESGRLCVFWQAQAPAEPKPETHA